MRKVFNMSSILGAAAFVSMIGVVAAVESEMYITAGVLLFAFAECARMSIKEGGRDNGLDQ